MKTQNLPVWKRQLPNIITWGRIAAIPAVMYFLHASNHLDSDTDLWADLWATIIFSVASISDFFDGYFARIFNVETRMGMFLDPVADKLLVTAALIMLIPLDRISPILVVLLLSRDLMINGLRAVAAGEKMTIKASWTAKWKTGAQMTGIPFVMLRNLFGINILTAGQVLLWIALVLSVLSAFDYLKAFINRK
jgi:CDP-diacylglycerol--glycerol-3-phosphate 3-phosphatidyltransferase